MSSIENPSMRAGVAPVAEAATLLVDHIYRSLDHIGVSLVELWANMTADGRTPQSTDLSALRTVVAKEIFAQEGLFNGAGVVMAHGSLGDRDRYLEWWRPEGLGRDTQRLTLDLNPKSENYYDYTDMDWFAIPRDRNEKWPSGPYLDYTGVDLYVCTFAVPVRLPDSTFIAIAGADVPVACIEAKLLPLFRHAGTGLVLANADGRVIVGNDLEYTTGSKVRTSVSEQISVPKTPWSLVALDARR